MIKKRISLLFLFIVVAGLTIVRGQSLVLQLTNGTEETKDILALQKVFFSDENLNINYLNGSSDAFKITNLSKIYFHPLSSSVTSIAGTGKVISVYPNPAISTLNVRNAPDTEASFAIFRLDGVIIMESQLVEGNSSIDIASLNSGLYLLKIDNQVVRFIKK